MKWVIALGIILEFSQTSFGQSCGGYWIMHDSYKSVFKEYGHKGQPLGKEVFLVKQLSENRHSDSVQVLEERFNRRGILVATATGDVLCRNGSLWEDMRLIPAAMFLEKLKDVHVRAQPSVLGYPANMQVGDSLDEGFSQFTLTWHGKTLSTLDLAVTDRRVEGWDTIKLPVKAIVALRISYKVRIRTTMIGFGVPILFRYCEWYAPGFGLVRSETRGRKGRVRWSEMLVSIKNYP